MLSNIRGSSLPYHVVYEAVGKVPVVVVYCSTLEEAREETKRRNQSLPRPVSMPCDFYSVKTGDTKYGFAVGIPGDKLTEVPLCRRRGMGTTCSGKPKTNSASRGRSSQT